MKAIGILVIALAALLASLAIACVSGDATDTRDPGDGAVSGGGGGMVRPNTFLTYDGKRYELVNILQESMAPAREFQEAGRATEADIDLRGDTHVFTRTGDTSSIFTYSAPTADDGGLWLAWRVVS